MNVSHEMWQEQQRLSHIICKVQKLKALNETIKDNIQTLRKKYKWRGFFFFFQIWLLTSLIRCPLFVMHELGSEIFDSTSNTHILHTMGIMAVSYDNKQQQIIA